MLTDPTLTLADQIFWLVDVFMKTMAAEGCKRRIGLFSVAIWSRVKRFERRFLALYAEWKAGTLPKARVVRAAATPHPDPPPQGGREKSGAEAAFDPGAHDAASFERAKQRPVSVLPRTFRWMQGMLPISAGTIASGLSSLIDNHPEMKAFVAEVPQAGRMLRPICEMAGLRLPEWLVLPKRVRKKKEPPRLSEADEAELRRITAWFPDTPPGRRAKWALAADVPGQAGRSDADVGDRARVGPAPAARRSLPAAGDRVRRAVAAAAEGLCAAEGLGVRWGKVRGRLFHNKNDMLKRRK